MIGELNRGTKVGDRACWITIDGKRFTGVLKEWDNATAIMLLDDGSEKAVAC